MAKKLIQVVYKVDNKELKDTTAEVRKLENETKASEKGFKNIGSAGSAAFSSIAGAVAALGLVQLQKQIIQITSEFQKFQAVLTNTLGSRSAANAAMQQIQEFAAKTPFSVQELTSSFVKLANQGFKPTTAEMRKLGDVAASTGKSFDMLTEAIIDAQVGEFERLKEFGIRASKQGDQVTFAFKGVQTQTEFTATAIRDYVLSLGDAIGVSGSMAAISETLGGKISNLGDSWDQLMLTIGNSEKGVFRGVINLLDEALKKANELLTTDEQERLKEQTKTYTDQQEKVKKILETEKDLEKARDKALSDLHEELRLIDQKIKQNDKILSQRDTPAQTAIDAYKERNDLVNKYNDLVNEGQQGIIEYVAEIKKKDAEEANNSKTIKSLTDNTDKLTDAQKRQLDAINARGKGKSPVNLMGDLYKQWSKDISKDIEDVNSKDPSPISLVLTGGKNTDEISEELDMILDMSFKFLDDLFQASLHSREESFKAEEDDFNRRMLMAGDNERRRQEIAIEKDAFDKEQAKKKQEFDKAQDKKDRDRVIKKMLIDTFLTSLKASADGPPFPNLFKAKIALAFGLAQVALAKAIPFKDGVIDLQGPGTATSDSIPARLSRGESVMTADETARSYNLLTAIRENKIDDRILEKLNITNRGIVVNLNDDRIVKAINSNRAPSLVREGYTIMETYSKGNSLKIKQRAKLGL